MKKQSVARIWVHALFSTKNCQPLMLPNAQQAIFEHFRAQLMELGCFPKVVTGMPDHVHLLFLSNPTISICNIIKQIKGNTSHWINDHDLAKSKFVWQKGFNAFSENDDGLIHLMEKLNGQSEYHAARSYLQEVDELKGAHSSAERDHDEIEGDY